MMNDRIPGAVIRRERAARSIEQKALCRGICVPSYLSKIERGGAIPNGEILDALYARLGLPRLDVEALARAEALVGEDYRRALYGLDLDETLEALDVLYYNIGATLLNFRRFDEAEWECRPDFLKSPDYLALLDRLLAALSRDYHFGHISFYQDVYLAACKKQRQYRKALDFQREISSRSVKIIG